MSTSVGIWSVIVEISAVFGCLNNIIICCYLIYQYHQEWLTYSSPKQIPQKQKTSQCVKYRSLYILSLISILFSILFCLLISIGQYPWTHHCLYGRGAIYICLCSLRNHPYFDVFIYPFLAIGASLFQTTKISMYLYFVIRFEVAFYESQYALNRITLIILYIAIIVYWIIFEILVIISWPSQNNNRLKNGPCVGLPIYLILSVVAWDVICTLCLSILFSTKLYNVHKSLMKVIQKDIRSIQRLESFNLIAIGIKLSILPVFASCATILRLVNFYIIIISEYIFFIEYI